MVNLHNKAAFLSSFFYYYFFPPFFPLGLLGLLGCVCTCMFVAFLLSNPGFILCSVKFGLVVSAGLKACVLLVSFISTRNSLHLAAAPCVLQECKQQKCSIFCITRGSACFSYAAKHHRDNLKSTKHFCQRAVVMRHAGLSLQNL